MDKIILTTQTELADLIKKAVASAFLEYQNTQPEPEKQFLNIDEACKFLHLAKQTIYGYTSKDEIPFIKRGKKLYFKKADLEKWLLGNKNTAL